MEPQGLPACVVLNPQDPCGKIFIPENEIKDNVVAMPINDQNSVIKPAVGISTFSNNHSIENCHENSHDRNASPTPTAAKVFPDSAGQVLQHDVPSMLDEILSIEDFGNSQKSINRFSTIVDHCIDTDSSSINDSNDKVTDQSNLRFSNRYKSATSLRNCNCVDLPTIMEGDELLSCSNNSDGPDEPHPVSLNKSHGPLGFTPTVLMVNEEVYDDITIKDVDECKMFSQIASSNVDAVVSKSLCAPESGRLVKASCQKRLIPEGLSDEDFYERSKQVSHPIDRESQIQNSLKAVIAYNHEMSDQEIRAERKRTRAWLYRMGKRLRNVNKRIYDEADPEIKPLLKRKNGVIVNVALMQYLSDLSGTRDTEYAYQFSTGFPIIGEIPKANLWKNIQPEIAEKGKISVSELDANHKQIFDEMKARHKPGKEHQKEPLWKACKKDLDNGYAKGPFYTEEEVSKALGTEKWYPAPRFPCDTPRPIFNKDGTFELVRKVRAIDDEAANQTNLAAYIRERMVLNTPDDIAATIKFLRHMEHDCLLSGTAIDMSSAFRNVPVLPEHRRHQVVAAWDCELDKPAWLIMRGHTFGASASMLNFNRLSTLLVRILRVICHIPTAHYIDDFWTIERKGIAKSGLKTKLSLFQILGFPTDHDGATKTQDSNDGIVVLLGVEFSLNGKQATVRIPEVKKKVLDVKIQAVLDENILTPAQAGKLRGSLLWASSYLFGNIGRSSLHALITRQYTDSKNFSVVGTEIEKSLKELRNIINAQKERPIPEKQLEGSHVTIFTDGMSEGDKKGIGGVVYDPKTNDAEWWTGETPDCAKNQWKRNKGGVRVQDILNIELYAIFATIKKFGKVLNGRNAIFYVDNQAAHAVLSKSTANENDTRRLVRSIYHEIDKLQTCPWWVWVESKANISDDPSRYSDANAKEQIEIERKMKRLKIRYRKIGKLPGYGGGDNHYA